MSTVVGIHDGHNASVAVIRNGVVELALQEERLTRVKNQGDQPEAGIALARRTAPAYDAVALNGNYMRPAQWRRDTIASDYKRCSSLGSRVKQTLKNTAVDRWYQRHQARTRSGRLVSAGLDANCLRPVEHHLAHAAAAYFTSPQAARGAKVLVFTCDGSGDRLSATVSIGWRGKIERVAEVSEHDSIGRLYALVTSCLGMVPMEHEYKLMGLAPYAKPETCGCFDDWFEFKPGSLGWSRRRGLPPMSAAHALMSRTLTGVRFDRAAADAQALVEKLLPLWIERAIRETGIRSIACSGGVFMNVKANLKILELPELEEMYVFPSCGDESNSIGAACWEAARRGDTIQPLGGLYFGDPITDLDSEKALEPAARLGRLRMDYDPGIERRVAIALARGEIVARVKGAAEFGARALGNRSILAPAGSSQVVPRLNQSIKRRDFWMPFAPSVLAERAAVYYHKPKYVSSPYISPYMMFAFRAKPSSRQALAAVCHPYDGTTRPQEVTEAHNPSYYKLLKEYEERTGEGVVLNTSFNLHGEPMVYSARDAVSVFLRSGLKNMALGNWWVEKD